MPRFKETDGSLIRPKGAIEEYIAVVRAIGKMMILIPETHLHGGFISRRTWVKIVDPRRKGQVSHSL